MDKTGRAPGSIPEPELQEFHTGAAAHAYRTFGCHALSGAAGHRFAVWAPHAQRVALVGDFNKALRGVPSADTAAGTAQVVSDGVSRHSRAIRTKQPIRSSFNPAIVVGSAVGRIVSPVRNR